MWKGWGCGLVYVMAWVPPPSIERGGRRDGGGRVKGERKERRKKERKGWREEGKCGQGLVRILLNDKS